VCVREGMGVSVKSKIWLVACAFDRALRGRESNTNTIPPHQVPATTLATGRSAAAAAIAQIHRPTHRCTHLHWPHQLAAASSLAARAGSWQSACVLLARRCWPATRTHANAHTREPTWGGEVAWRNASSRSGDNGGGGGGSGSRRSSSRSSNTAAAAATAATAIAASLALMASWQSFRHSRATASLAATAAAVSAANTDGVEDDDGDEDDEDDGCCASSRCSVSTCSLSRFSSAASRSWFTLALFTMFLARLAYP
jgi:hypothetical protein